MAASGEYPAMTTKPRYLTGDKAGLKEFLDKFDVRWIDIFNRLCLFDII